MINVLVVDDSAFMRKMISDFLEEDSAINVIAKARNGEDALEKIVQYKPDVVTLDVEMPVMNGIHALKVIMEKYPTPTIMLSSTTKEGAETTIEAMELGAFDFIPKPSGPISLDIHKVKSSLVEKVKWAAKTKVTKLSKFERKKSLPHSHDIKQINKRFSSKSETKTVVAIGTSTGGPKALQEVLPVIPECFPHPILIVQHMPKGFTKSLSQRLNSLSKITVKEAEDGEILKQGVAYIAPGGYHLLAKKMGTSIVIKLDVSEPVNGHRPSVDTMFNSLCQLNVKVIAAILTGMGSDGTKGLLNLKMNTQTCSIAESEMTSIVYGMPRSAVETRKVDFVLDLEDVAPKIVSECN
ncbi:protein-glutamate methylesterase/protein-glutamine glutaminase [Evansella halocellulosilytica]|uniref:protein-glutamate methylesterase/protein-glutamine glutaminase n=1 Tax=Evansella halocellulosilytica TaxID=2011013 RepID=UPI000BB7FB0C|nr:chemotaxis response regulator protein-glutamate methylesterase [Evansella halocellulosilytica]